MSSGYPGQVTPSPIAGQANYTQPTQAPLVGKANPPTPVIQPEIGVVNKVINPPTTQTVGQAVKLANTPAPDVGVPAHTPLVTPLGVHPQFKTPTETWSYDYGNGP